MATDKLINQSQGDDIINALDDIATGVGNLSYGEQTSADKVVAMTGYQKESTAAAISPGDSLNVAIGKLEKKVDEATQGPASSTDEHLVMFDGISGKAVKDSGLAIADSDDGMADSDTQVPTSKNVKKYVDETATGISRYLGTIDALNELSTDAKKGDFYIVSTAWTGVHVKDEIIAEKNSPSQSIDGVNWKLLHNEENTDENVAQSPVTTNADYEVLFSGTADNTAHTEGTGKDTGIKFNPSTDKLSVGGEVAANKFTGSGAELTGLTGASAGNYGVSAAATPSYGGEFKVPYIQVDSNGRITGITDNKVTLPASDNTDAKVKRTNDTSTNKDYKVLFTNETTDADATDFALKSDVTYNPSTKKLKVNNDPLVSSSSLVDVIDDGAKNILSVDSCNVSAATYLLRNEPISDITEGTYIFHIYTTSATASGIQVIFSNGADTGSNRTGICTLVPNTGRSYAEFSVSTGTTHVTLYVNEAAVIPQIMVCVKSQYDISDKYVPYALPNYELTSQLMEINQLVRNTQPIYGYRIDKKNLDPDTRVEYLFDAVGMTPAYMNFSTGQFNYGSWGDIWFIKNNKPVALNFDGTEAFELNPTNYWQKSDGTTAIDIEDATLNYNYMSRIPTVYVKRWEDSQYNYVAFTQYPQGGFTAYAHQGASGRINENIYLPMFKGFKDSNGKLRSLAGKTPWNTTGGVGYELDAAKAIATTNNGWQIWDFAKHELISDLLTLISKNTSSRWKFGKGVIKTASSAAGFCKGGYEYDGTTKATCAQFWGTDEGTGNTPSTEDGSHHVRVFHIEDLWGNRWDRCLGLHLINGIYKVKMFAPYYATAPTGSGALLPDETYETLTLTPPSGNYLQNQSTGFYGNIPISTSGDKNKGYCSYFWQSSGADRLLIFGGGCGYGFHCSARCLALNSASVNSYWPFGASPCFNHL